MGPGQIGRLTSPTHGVLVLLGGVAFVVGLLALGIVAKSAHERLRDRRLSAIDASVRQSFYTRLASAEPEWGSFVADLSKIERRRLIGHVVRTTDIVTGSTADSLTDVADALNLRQKALSAIDSPDRYERLWGLKLCIAFGWTPDPERLLAAISESRDEGEAAIRVLATDADRITRLAGVEIACRYESLSIYGMTALHELVRRDPRPLLEKLDRREIEAPALMAQILNVLAHSDPVTDGAPLDGVLACLNNQDPTVRANACLVLARYGWRNDVRDKTDLRLSDLLEDSSRRVRISAYYMLGTWGDTAARAKLERAAEVEQDSRAQFAIAQARHGEGALESYLAEAGDEAKTAPLAGLQATGRQGWMAPL